MRSAPNGTETPFPPRRGSRSMRLSSTSRAATCLGALLVLPALAGCLDETYDPGLPTPTTDPTPGPGPDADRDEEGGLVLTGTLDRATIASGEDTTATFRLENKGADVAYTSGGCGPSPWVYEIVAPNGSVVGPLGPDPRCLGPPTSEVTLEAGDALDGELAWDGIERTRDPDTLEVRARELPPGTYEIRASVTLTRGGETFEPDVALRIVVTA